MQIGHTRDDAALSEGKGSKNPSGRWTDGFAEGRCGRGRGELGYPVAVARARGPLDREWGLFSKKDLPAETEALPPCAFRCRGLQPAWLHNERDPQDLLRRHACVRPNSRHTSCPAVGQLILNLGLPLHGQLSL